MRSVKYISSQETLRMIYFFYIHSTITYGIIFWAISHPALKHSAFKKNIRIITNSRSRDSCRDLYKKTKILPLCSQDIYTMSYIVNNKHLYKTNIDFNTTYNTNLHPPISNLTKFQKGLITLE